MLEGVFTIENQLINYILEVYKQTWEISQLPEDIEIKCFDAIDYYNALNSNIDDKYKKLPAILITENNKKIIYVNETEITGENRYFSLEVFLSILSSIYIDTLDSVKRISKKPIVFLNGLKLLKSFNANLMTFNVLDILFEEEDSPYKKIDHLSFLTNLLNKINNETDEEKKIDYLGYMLSKLNIFSKYSEKNLLNNIPQNINILHTILNKIEIKKKISFVDLYKINRAYNKCIM